MHPPEHAVAAVTHPDPYPYYATLAARRVPWYDAGLRLWIAAHPTLLRDVLAHPDCRVRPAHELVPASLAGPLGSVFGALVRMNDGPRHASGKAVLTRALAAVPMGEVQACARHVAAGLANPPALNRFAAQVPMRTVARLLGFTDDGLPRIAALAADFATGLSPLADAVQVDRAQGATLALLDAMRSLVDRRPRGALLDAVLAGEWADEHALLANLCGLLSQTFDATSGLLGNAIVARLRGSTEEPTALVARVMATDPAIHNTRRFTAAPVTFGDIAIPAGETILLVLANGMGFGAGRHACPGEAMAQAIVTGAVEALLAAGPLPDVRWNYRPSVNARVPVFDQQEAA
jgi:cytochrome P450